MYILYIQLKSAGGNFKCGQAVLLFRFIYLKLVHILHNIYYISLIYDSVYIWQRVSTLFSPLYISKSPENIYSRTFERNAVLMV